MPDTNTTQSSGSAPLTIEVLFQKAREMLASDVHIAVGKPPMIRFDGTLQPMEGYSDPLGAEQVRKLVDSILSESQRERYQREREIDLSYQIPQGTRFRVNCHFERGYTGLVARIIPDQIPTMDQIHLPSIAGNLTKLSDGIILCVGPTGSGKSTTLASMVSAINHDRPAHIVTMEDPIEFLHQSDKAVIRQRQFGTDFLSFGEALRRVLRQDPNVVLVGEMRDLETIGAALTLAETGHLILATLHTQSAAQTIDRIIDVFPPHQQDQIRMQLSMTLRAVISQRLVPRKGGGRVAAREVMLCTPAVSNIIRDNRIPELGNVIQTSAGEGMITMERDVARLYEEGLLEKDVAEMIVAQGSVVPEDAKPSEKKKKKGIFG